jgi:hypothetical protein
LTAYTGYQRRAGWHYNVTTVEAQPTHHVVGILNRYIAEQRNRIREYLIKKKDVTYAVVCGEQGNRLGGDRYLCV